ncbi:MAG TPA: glutamate--cysteine ligase [Candidatus Paceibacterota bacterium]|uniref:Glutamate--cysteine ligase n=1 Tax=Candidatus Ryanbacteria bacterium RIFCSPHIGHO2_01_FULL_45_22 TaxID=1802114 RepID=A0A1G2FZ81_9BACT|nr:MAG: glutamate--cysteine ligase [Candidatus Ryanbacteria bacterium RIFCSPHIGHO2_01_FULL_45_22]
MEYLLREIKQGLEREAIRTDKNGVLARTSHPKVLGAPLTHPYITLDFAEAQIEFVTPPLTREAELRNFASKLYDWTSQNMGNELLWPYSMPPKLPPHRSIPLANFGKSADAKQKHIYREGLKQRYGGAVQTISGIHYNFSLSDNFWETEARIERFKADLSIFKDDRYFSLMRNVIRYVPLLTYLFGASPVADETFFRKKPSELQTLNHSMYLGQYATSLRQSRFGYSNLSNQVSVSFNSLDEYLNDLYRAITTSSKLWSSIGVHKDGKQIQLNMNILQLENEFYSAIRPKQKHGMHAGESALASLACSGVEYVELRSIDIDPYEPAGIGKAQLQFLQAFMTYCLLTPSPRFKKGEQRKWEANQSTVALYGRKPGLHIFNGSKQEKFTSWALRHLDGISKTARLLDQGSRRNIYSSIVNLQKEKVLNPDLTPSAKIIQELRVSGHSYLGWGLSLAKNYKSDEMTSHRINESYDNKMQEISRKSLSEAARIEAKDNWILKGYEHLELSTQVLIRAAQKRNIAVKVLDDELNVIELSRGNKKEIVKQATITKYDTYLSYELMNDKSLTKSFLDRAGLSSPRGGRFRNEKDAINFCYEHRSFALVVKPATTNFGTGVVVLARKSPKNSYEKAVRQAFKYDSLILIEEFIPGKEYRFLVIDGRVIAVLNREPANLLGDGKHTIKELVFAKNTDPKSYKLPEAHIQLGSTEISILAEAGLSVSSIPARGKKVYLRKNSNVHSGGDPIGIDDMPQFYKEIAIKAASTVGAKMCGVDMIIKSVRRKKGKNNYSIIELNWNPAIFMHAYPFKGKPRDVGGAILDFLGF